MIVRLGILALLQMTTLPGLLLTRRLRFDSLISKGVAVFISSLLFNYFAVALLTACHQYRQRSLIILIGIELALAAWCLWRGRRTTVQAVPPLSEDAYPDAKAFSGILRLALTCSVAILAMVLWEWLQSMGGVFDVGDAVASWNRWALDWGANHWPKLTWSYPQLLPTNWSIASVLIGGKEGEMFARGIMGAFPAAVYLMILDLQRRFKHPWLTVSMAAAYVILDRTLAGLQFDGWADAPVAALSFAGIYFQLLAREDVYPRSSLLAAALCYGAASLTKQAGLCVMAGGFVWLFTDKKLRAVVTDAGRSGKIVIGLLLLGALHWYAIHYAVSKLHLGAPGDDDAQLIKGLTLYIHEGRNLTQRIAHGFGLLGNYFSPALLAVMGVLLLSSLGTSNGRRSMFCFVLPGLLIWLVAFSYDIRNLAMAMPPAALAMGLGASCLARWLSNLAGRFHLPAKIPWGSLTAGLVLVALVAMPVSDDEVRRHYLQARRHAGDFRLNREIDRLTGSGGTILSSYLQLQIQPGFAKRTVYFPYPFRSDVEFSMRLSLHPWIVADEHLKGAEEDTRNSLVKNGTLLELAREGGFVIYRNTTVKVPSKDAAGQNGKLSP